MGNQLINSLVTVALAIIGVAIVAVIVSKNANTTSVISSAGSAFGNVLGVAEAPVTGGGGGLSGLNNFPFGGGGYIGQGDYFDPISCMYFRHPQRWT